MMARYNSNIVVSNSSERLGNPVQRSDRAGIDLESSMDGCEDKDKSMQQRISNILTRDRSGKRDFGVWTLAEAEDAEEIEYLLARAEVDLRKAQARVDELKAKLARSQ